MYTAPNCNSWYLGDNIPGKVRVFLPWVGGLDSVHRAVRRGGRGRGYEGLRCLS